MKERRSTQKYLPQLVVKSGTPITARLRIPEGWSVSLNRETFSFALKATGRDLYSDPFEVRERFLEIGTPKEALAFLKRFGPLDVESGTPGMDLPPGAGGKASPLSFADLLDVQKFYKKVLLEPKYWKNRRNFDTGGTNLDGMRAYVRLNLLRSPIITISLKGAPSFESVSGTVSQAIYTTIYIDWLNGIKSIHCPVCNRIVRPRSQHYQRFCSTRCGNVSRKAAYLRAKEKRNVA